MAFRATPSIPTDVPNSVVHDSLDEQSLLAAFSTSLERQTDSEKGIVVMVQSIEVSTMRRISPLSYPKPMTKCEIHFADLQPTLKQAADALLRLIEEATQQHSAQLSLQVSSCS